MNQIAVFGASGRTGKLFTELALKNGYQMKALVRDPSKSDLSPTIRIQSERGQGVISAGPYAIVRHPGYASFLLAAFASGLALNSLLSPIPAVISVVNLVNVAAIEDQMLRDELAGYAEYAAKVRYRLIPGIW